MRRAAMTAVILAACACGERHKGIIPDAGGKPYEVLVVSDNDTARNIMSDILGHDTDGLPQPEPMFDVSATGTDGYTPTVRMARAIVVVKTDSRQFTATSIKYERDAYARAQIIIYVNTPSAEALKNDIHTVGPHVAQMLTRAEMNTAIGQMSENRNANAGRMADSIVGCAITVPARMRRSKRGNRFVWFSDDAPSGMQNICIYSFDGLNISPEHIITMRDSIMKANIPGEKPGMYMTTTEESTHWTTENTPSGKIIIGRGLWEMKGDAMGGPFVCHCIADSAHNRTIVAEAFVYAPEMKKRNKIRQAEAALYTMSLNRR